MSVYDAAIITTGSRRCSTGITISGPWLQVYSPPQRHLVNSRSEEGSSGCRNVNKFSIIPLPLPKGCFWCIYVTYWVIVSTDESIQRQNIDREYRRTANILLRRIYSLAYMVDSSIEL